jgi:outer membrane protein assembly factor BamB
VYFASGNGSLYAVEAATGIARWRFTTPDRTISDAIFTNPTVVAGVVYVGSIQDMIYALDSATGHELWHRTVAGSVVNTPAVAAGRIYFGTEAYPPQFSDARFFYALDALTGTISWRVPLESETSSAPAVVAGTVYITGIGLGLYALDALTGKTLWQFHHGGSVIGTAPTVAYDTVYITFDNSLYALDAQSGAEYWHFNSDQGYFLISPTMAGNAVYCATLNVQTGAQHVGPGRIYAIDAQSGQPLGTFPVAGDIGNAVAIVDGVAYMKSSDGYLYAIR